LKALDRLDRLDVELEQLLSEDRWLASFFGLPPSENGYAIARLEQGNFSNAKDLTVAG
jgi:hypothetical protein